MNLEHISDLSKKHNIKLGIQILLQHELLNWQISEKSTVVFSCSESEENVQQGKEIKSAAPLKNLGETTIDVGKILNSSSQGRVIIQKYETTNSLNEGSRRIIVDLIINSMIQTDVRMTVILALKISQDIVKIFPSEFLVHI